MSDLSQELSVMQQRVQQSSMNHNILHRDRPDIDHLTNIKQRNKDKWKCNFCGFDNYTNVSQCGNVRPLEE